MNYNQFVHNIQISTLIKNLFESMKIADTHQNKLKLVTVYLSQLSEFTIHTPPYQGKTCINRNNHYTYHYH